MGGHKTELEEQLEASLNAASGEELPDGAKAEQPTTSRVRGKRRADVARRNGLAKDVDPEGSVRLDEAPPPVAKDTSRPSEFYAAEQMTLRQKLGEVRRRIGYIQKRGYTSATTTTT